MKKSILKSATGLLILLLTTCITGETYAQKVPISFDKYHGYTGTVKYLKDVAKAYPAITELQEIGQSELGKPIHVLVITNLENGTPLDSFIPLRNMRKENIDNVPAMKSHMAKPGHFISGGTHGNEFTGTEVCLYIINQLVSGYGTDDEITRLIDRYAFYICPTINPEGVYNSVEKGMAQRYNSSLTDDDGDGEINEDGPDDLNGDGLISRFRYPDPSGRYVLDTEDPRVLVRARNNTPKNIQRYSVVTEDKDNDKDGKRGEDGVRGIDLNRNYPEGWWTDDGFAGGSGDYPTSASETHAIAEFFTNYRNLFMAQFYHTSGGFTYRPMGTAPHTSMKARDVAVLDLIMGKKYLEIIGEEVPKAWQDPSVIPAEKKRLREEGANKYAVMRGYVLPRGWKVSYSEDRDRRYSYGMATDWAFKQYGIYSVTTELWNPAMDIEGLVDEGEEIDYAELQRRVLKYQDENYGGELFLDWEPFTHPELGKGELGGWKTPVSRNNAFPGKPLEDLCRKHWEFEKFRAGLMPVLDIRNVQHKVLYQGKEGTSEIEHDGDMVSINRSSSGGSYTVIEITADIVNIGALPTHLKDGEKLDCNREDVVWLAGDRDNIRFIQGNPYQEIGVLGGTRKIPNNKESLKNSHTVRWVLGVKGDQTIHIIASSQKGGTRVQSINVK